MKIETLDRAEAATTLAIVAASNEPLLFLTADQRIIAASDSFYRAFEISPAKTRGVNLSELGQGEWAMPKLASFVKASLATSVPIDPYEIDLERPNRPVRHLVLNARILEDGAPRQKRVLLTITDLTLARTEAALKDQLIVDKAMLVQEMQHRVANSLQIIASLLLQSARRVQSEEARGFLQNAHHRVMSIAAVQKQLAISVEGDVKLRPYLTQLCDSLGASMISETANLAIKVQVDDSVVHAAKSASLGLIVTELVINALKHAFPEQAPGTISVDYTSLGTGWTLTVADDGVGMAAGLKPPKAGLGTSIVEALSKNLDGRIETRDGAPGTVVTISHPAAGGQQMAGLPQPERALLQDLIRGQN